MVSLRLLVVEGDGGLVLGGAGRRRLIGPVLGGEARCSAAGQRLRVGLRRG
jgi:hypothetical protein